MSPTMYDPRLDPNSPYYQGQSPQITSAPPPAPQPQSNGFNPLLGAALGIGAIATGVAALRGRRGVQLADLSKAHPVPRPPAPHPVEVPAPRNIPIEVAETVAPQIVSASPPATVRSGRTSRGMNTSPTRNLASVETPAPRVVSSGGVTAETFTPAEFEAMFGAPSNMPTAPHAPLRQPAPAPVQRVMSEDPRLQATLSKYGLTADDLDSMPGGRAEVVSLHREAGVPLSSAPRFTPTPSPQLFDRGGVGYPSFKTEWGEIGGVQQPYPNYMLEGRGVKASDFQNERQTLGSIDAMTKLGLTKGQNAENIGEVYMRGTSNDAVYRPSATPQRWVDQPLQQVDAYANGGPAWVKGDDGILALGERDRPVSQIMHDLDTEHGFKGAVDWRQLSSNMPSSDTLDAAPQWAVQPKRVTEVVPLGGHDNALYAATDRDARQAYADSLQVNPKSGSFNIVSDPTEKGDGNWLKPADITVSGVGTFPLTRGATVEVGGQTFSRNPGDYFDMDAQDAIEFKRGQAKEAATKFLTGMDSPTVSPTESLANQRAYELHRQGLTDAEREYASAYRQMEMPEQVTYKGRVSLPAGQADPVKQYLASKGLEVDAVTLPRDPGQTHVTFRGASDLPTQMEVQRVLGKDADREVLQLPPGYSIAPENVHGFAKLHPGAQPGQLYKGVEWGTDANGKQVIVKAGEPVLNDRGKPQGWAGQPVQIVEGIDRPTVTTIPSAFRDVPADIDPEMMGMRDKWKQEREDFYAAKLGRELPADPIARAAVQASNDMSLRERAQALVARKMAQRGVQ